MLSQKGTANALNVFTFTFSLYTTSKHQVQMENIKLDF